MKKFSYEFYYNFYSNEIKFFDLEYLLYRINELNKYHFDFIINTFKLDYSLCLKVWAFLTQKQKIDILIKNNIKLKYIIPIWHHLNKEERKRILINKRLYICSLKK